MQFIFKDWSGQLMYSSSLFCPTKDEKAYKIRQYKHLTEAQRYQIEALKKAGNSQQEIAYIIGVSSSTISREVKRNTG